MSLLKEEGRFHATVKDVELGVAQTGTEFIQFNFETDEGSTTGRLYLSEKAFQRSLNILKECFGFDGDFENLEQIIGQECSITTEFEEYENGDGQAVPRLNVKWINPKGGPKLAPEERQSLAAKLSAMAGFKVASKAKKTEEVEDFDDEKDPF